MGDRVNVASFIRKRSKAALLGFIYQLCIVVITRIIIMNNNNSDAIWTLQIGYNH